MDAISSEVGLVESCGHFAMCTSHQAFNQIIAGHLQQQISIQVLDYSLLFANGSIKVQALSPIMEFVLDSSSKLSTRKPRAKLPFGLKLPVKPRKEVKGKKKKQRICKKRKNEEIEGASSKKG